MNWIDIKNPPPHQGDGFLFFINVPRFEYLLEQLDIQYEFPSVVHGCFFLKRDKITFEREMDFYLFLPYRKLGIDKHYELIIKKNITHYSFFDCPKITRYRNVNAQKKLKVLKRDRYRCKICQRSPSDDNHTALEIDHIIPFSAGGSDELENLQTLCFNCNRSKKWK